jgi:hypothetical protein
MIEDQRITLSKKLLNELWFILEKSMLRVYGGEKGSSDTWQLSPNS